MVRSARVRRTQRDDGAAAPVLPEDLVLWEIFYRLPAKELLRCGAVSRSWRRLACDAEFLLAHHRRQPSLPLVLLNNVTRSSKVPPTVDALDLRQSPAARRPDVGFSSPGECRKYYVHASCEGLLLLSRTYRLYYICNPATRQWCALPNVAALYHHRPSGEYRVLYSDYLEAAKGLWESKSGRCRTTRWSKGKLVDKFQENFVTPKVLRLSFKESLVRHVFFERKDRKRVKLPCFFRGL